METLLRQLTSAFDRLLEGLSPLALINKVIPRSGYLEHRGIVHGSLDRQKHERNTEPSGGGVPLWGVLAEGAT